MSVYSERGGVAGAAMAASETDHLECRRSAFRECNRETLTPEGGGGRVRIESCGRHETLSDMNFTLEMFWQSSGNV